MRPHEALAAIICAALAAACSSQSQHAKPVVVAQVPAASTSSTATSASTAATVAGTASAPAAPAGGAVDPSLAKVDPALIKAGYRVERRQAKILYCKTQTVTGTKFGNTVCRTAEQIHEEQRETELSQRMLIRSGPANCVGTQCSK
ncbi:MAG: hypothetical protein WA803_11075 [Steroidobacteraceae bacterium]